MESITKIVVTASNGKSITFSSISSNINDSIKNLFKDFLEDPEKSRVYKELPNEFQKNVEKYLQTIHDDTKAQEKFLTSLTGIWKYYFINEECPKAIQYLETLLNRIIFWEYSNNLHINKGCIYYFLGGTYILNGSYSQGFLNFHSSYEEDKLAQNGNVRTNTPAFRFITLDTSNDEQYWGHLLWGVTGLLETRLDLYNKYFSSNFSYVDFRNDFLKQADLDIIFLFSFTVIRIFALEAIDARHIVNSVFLAHYRKFLLFDLLVVIENAIKVKGREGTFRIQAGTLLSTITDPKLTIEQMGEINYKEEHNTENALRELLDNNYKIDNDTIPIRERSILISYLLRNTIAHSTKHLVIINDRFLDIQQEIFNMLFLVVENLYKPCSGTPQLHY